MTDHEHLFELDVLTLQWVCIRCPERINGELMPR